MFRVQIDQSASQELSFLFFGIVLEHFDASWGKLISFIDIHILGEKEFTRLAFGYLCFERLSFKRNDYIASFLFQSRYVGWGQK